MIEGVTLAGAAPTQKSVGEVAAQEKKTEAGSTVNLEKAQRQQEPNDARVEAVVRDEKVTSESTGDSSSGNPDIGPRLSIGHDDDAGRFVYRALDSVTHEVERQYPPDADLKRSALLKEYLGGLVNKTA